MYKHHMSEPILGTFMLQPLSKEDETRPDPIGPLPFEDAVAVLITDYGAHPHEARELVISAAKHHQVDVMSAVTHNGVQVIYSA